MCGQLNASPPYMQTLCICSNKDDIVVLDNRLIITIQKQSDAVWKAFWDVN